MIIGNPGSDDIRVAVNDGLYTLPPGSSLHLQNPGRNDVADCQECQEKAEKYLAEIKRLENVAAMYHEERDAVCAESQSWRRRARKWKRRAMQWEDNYNADVDAGTKMLERVERERDEARAELDALRVRAREMREALVDLSAPSELVTLQRVRNYAAEAAGEPIP